MTAHDNRAIVVGVDEGVLDAIGNRSRLDLDVDEPLARAVITGRGALVSEVTEEHLVAGIAEEDDLRLRRALGVRSAIVVPLVRDSRVVGLMAVASVDDDRRYGPDDLAVLEHLGRLMGAALASEPRSP